MSFQKRILKDFKGFSKEPITDCFVRVSDKDITCWDAFVVLDLGGKRCPLHMAISFPTDYPATAPSAGFSCSDFGYKDGAVYVNSDRDSYFYGKLIICLDILGNFAKVHDEWAGIAGSGWSPAYTISSLLCNVHVTLNECTSKLSKHAQDVLYKECMDFLKTFDTSELTPAFCNSTLAAAGEELPPAGEKAAHTSKAEVTDDGPSDFRPTARRYLRSTTEHFSDMMAKFGEPPMHKMVEILGTVSDRLGALLVWHEASADEVGLVKEKLAEMGWDVRGRVVKEGAELSLAKLLKALTTLDLRFGDDNNTSSDQKSLTVDEPDSTIACWYSFEHYTESVLGVGIVLERGRAHTTLATDGELISIGAYEGGLRQTPTKTTFEYFLPAFISPVHSTGSMQSSGRDWEQCLVKSVILIGNAVRNLGESKIEVGRGLVDIASMQKSRAFANFVLRIYSDIINSMVVKIMQPESDVRASERIFRVLIDCWRTLYWFKQKYPCVSEVVVARVKSFTEQVSKRNKKIEPNIGCLLALRTVVSDAEVPILDFFHAYIEESSLRGVMWWRKNGVEAVPGAVFDATKVSRRLFLFQSLFLTHSITGDLEETAALADRTECKLSDRLDVLLARFKKEVELEEQRLDRRAPGQELYEAYFKACSCPYMHATKDLSSWIEKQAQTAQITEGYFFSNNGFRGGGGGRGGGKGGGDWARRNNRW